MHIQKRQQQTKQKRLMRIGFEEVYTNTCMSKLLFAECVFSGCLCKVGDILQLTMPYVTLLKCTKLRIYISSSLKKMMAVMIWKFDLLKPFTVFWGMHPFLSPNIHIKKAARVWLNIL
jgi:hypothetical protein